MEEHACDLSAWEVEMGWPQAGNQPGLERKLQTSEDPTVRSSQRAKSWAGEMARFIKCSSIMICSVPKNTHFQKPGVQTSICKPITRVDRHSRIPGTHPTTSLAYLAEFQTSMRPCLKSRVYPNLHVYVSGHAHACMHKHACASQQTDKSRA